MDIFVYLTLCFTSLFTLMDPLGVMPVFLQMTDGMDTKERRYIALKACTIAFIIFLHYRAGFCFIFSASQQTDSGLWEVSSSLKSDMICCRHILPM